MDAKRKRFPLCSTDYKLYEEVGEGVSATVFRALCIPFNEIVAIKVLDLEKCNNDLDGIRREVQTMILIEHPNVLRAHCSFTTEHSLWVVMPYMAGGSCLGIMKSAHPEGLEEPVIATLLREVLKAIVYLHSQGHIHRDVKAGNILIDTNGSVKLADFGVSACMFDTGDRQRSRNTFVGTPCWMAPEVMQQLHGYDFKADIWSFGITALELAHGHAPFSKYPPMKVLLMTLQNAPPGLDYERDRRFSKSFKELVSACLVKDPKKRPSSEKLLKHPFFKHAKSPDYVAKSILDGIPPLGDRFRILKAKEADLLLQNKDGFGEHLSQQEYIRGISAWNFNLEDLKSQAALIEDYDGSFHEVPECSNSKKDLLENGEVGTEILSPERVLNSSIVPTDEDELNDVHDIEASLSSFPTLPLQALKSCFDVGEDTGAQVREATEVEFAQVNQSQLPQTTQEQGHEGEKTCGENMDRSCSLPRHFMARPLQKVFSGSLIPEHVLSPSRKVNGNGDRELTQPKYQSERNYSGPLYHQKRDLIGHTSGEEMSEGTVIQRKGRFKVTSADLSPKGSSANCFVSPIYGSSVAPTLTAASVLPSLHYILQQNTMQREQIVKLIKYVEQTPGHNTESTDASISDLSQVSAKERELQSQVTHLQQSIGILVEDLQKLKMKNAQMVRQLNPSSNRE